MPFINPPALQRCLACNTAFYRVKENPDRGLCGTCLGIEFCQREIAAQKAVVAQALAAQEAVTATIPQGNTQASSNTQPSTENQFPIISHWPTGSSGGSSGYSTGHPSAPSPKSFTGWPPSSSSEQPVTRQASSTMSAVAWGKTAVRDASQDIAGKHSVSRPETSGESSTAWERLARSTPQDTSGNRSVSGPESSVKYSTAWERLAMSTPQDTSGRRSVSEPEAAGLSSTTGKQPASGQTPPYISRSLPDGKYYGLMKGVRSPIVDSQGNGTNVVALAAQIPPPVPPPNSKPPPESGSPGTRASPPNLNPPPDSGTASSPVNSNPRESGSSDNNGQPTRRRRRDMFKDWWKNLFNIKRR
ncbi:hypothetical protein EDC01DRAFT_680175 [Geopyxis carbonaria]|nr:hypothetical protein EDC01DRAFT_680175 [Geopyxis carbonaria]